MMRADTLRIVAMPLPDADGIAAAAAFLSPAECALAQAYRHPRRHAEFVAGRMAAKRALLDSEGNALRICRAETPWNRISQKNAQVLPAEDGRPWGHIDAENKTIPVSISHAAGWVAAACSDRAIGIDIVDCSAPAEVRNAGAADWLENCTPQWRTRLAALIWGFQESLLKAGVLPVGTLWSTATEQVRPLKPAAAVIAEWPQPGCRVALQIQCGEKIVAGAFVALDAEAVLTMVLLPVPDEPGNQIQEMKESRVHPFPAHDEPQDSMMPI